MPSYLVETYLARGQAGERTDRERRARSAAAELTQENVPVSFERSIHVPEDELCFFIFDAPSGSKAALVAQRAQLDAIRVVEAAPSRNTEEEQCKQLLRHGSHPRTGDASESEAGRGGRKPQEPSSKEE